MNYAEQVTGQLADVQKQIEKLAKEDVSSVVKDIGKAVEENLDKDPYQALAMAFGVGFSLGALNITNLRNASIHIGKLVAFKSLSKMEAQQQGATHGS